MGEIDDLPGYLQRAMREFRQAVDKATRDAMALAVEATERYNQLTQGLSPAESLPHTGTCIRSYILHLPKEWHFAERLRVTCENSGLDDHVVCHSDIVIPPLLQQIYDNLPAISCVKRIMMRDRLLGCVGPRAHPGDCIIRLDWNNDVTRKEWESSIE